MRRHRLAECTLMLCAVLFAAHHACAAALVRDGAAQAPIVAAGASEAVTELHDVLQRVSGADFKIVKPTKSQAGLHVGLASDFPWLKLDDTSGLGPEGFIIKTEGDSVYLVAKELPGVQHAVTTFLQRLGCRWFFPGDVWAVIPTRPTIAGVWNERQTPSFPTQRRIWYGFGAYPRAGREHADWLRHNRMGGPIDVSIGHTWHGLNPDKDFEAHPDWFALVAGKRQPTKPCYTHPEVLGIAIAAAMKRADAGDKMISQTPPDGLGYCECDRCKEVFQGGEPFAEYSSLFARRPDGVLVNITSETLFRFINQIAAAVAAKHPGTLIGCYAYSAYSHPPSFDLHPNVYLQTTTAYRRTPITLAEQLDAFGQKTRQLGVREYYSVFQWDWDYPDPGKLTPVQLQEDLKFFRGHGVTAVNAEASNNWGPRGLGYYVAAQLMWDVNADTKAIVRDFYENAFGPAAPAIERYYVRWYGPSAAALPGAGAGASDLPEQQTLLEKNVFNVEALKAAIGDLDEAGRLAGDRADVGDIRERVDQLRMYLHYLTLRYRLWQAQKAGDKAGVLAAIEAETVFGGRLADTNLVHTRALVGKAFPRRFRAFEKQLADVPEAQQSGKGWRKLGDPPGHDELDRLWAADKKLLGLK